FCSRPAQDSATPGARGTAQLGHSTNTWRRPSTHMRRLAVANVAEIAAVFDRRSALELRGPTFLFNIPTRTRVARRVAKGALQGCHTSIEGALAQARDTGESILGGGTKGGTIGDVKRASKAGYQRIRVGIIDESMRHGRRPRYVGG